MTFEELNFHKHPVWEDGVQAQVSFANGYGASVIKSKHSYGGKQGLYELAVLKGGKLCYETPITDDVIGHLTPENVTEALQEIEALPCQ